MSEDHFCVIPPDHLGLLIHLAIDQHEALMTVISNIPSGRVLKYEELKCEEHSEITEAREYLNHAISKLLVPCGYPIHAAISLLKSGNSFADEDGNNMGAIS